MNATLSIALKKRKLGQHYVNAMLLTALTKETFFYVYRRGPIIICYLIFLIFLSFSSSTFCFASFFYTLTPQKNYANAMHARKIYIHNCYYSTKNSFCFFFPPFRSHAEIYLNNSVM